MTVKELVELLKGESDSAIVSVELAGKLSDVQDIHVYKMEDVVVLTVEKKKGK
jgi:hypothetical protein